MNIPFYTKTLPNGLREAVPAANTVFELKALTLGYVRDLTHHFGSGVDIGLGAQITWNHNPATLVSIYATQNSCAYEFVFCFRPALMNDKRAARSIEPQGDGRIAAMLDPNPSVAGRLNSFTVICTDAAGKPMIGDNAQATPNMTAMDMGNKTVQLKEIASGQYRGAVEFAMAGDWRVGATVGIPGGRQVRR